MTTALAKNLGTTLWTILSANAPAQGESNAPLISSSTKTPANASAKFIKCATITNTTMKKLVIASARTNSYVLTLMFGMRNSANVLKKNVPLKDVLQTTGGTQKPVNVSAKRKIAPTANGSTSKLANANVNKKLVRLGNGGMQTIAVAREIQEEAANQNSAIPHAHIIIQQLASVMQGERLSFCSKMGPHYLLMR